jgi:ubiquinone/menaquinone biosynthesis C-methylase UbiE
MGHSRKERSHLDGATVCWATVCARQAHRAALVAVWLDALDVQAGSRVLERGAGPGYVGLQAAQRLGPTGMVYAVDRSADARDSLADQQQKQGGAWMRRIVADGATLAPLPAPIDAALVTMVLHHCEDPGGVLRHVSRLLPMGARAVVAEFDPHGPCEVGPPRQERLEPDDVRGWCAAAGLGVLGAQQQSPDQYMLLVERER